MGNGVKTGNWVLVRAVLPLSLSAEADAKALGDWPTSHNLSVWTGQYWRFRLRRSVGAAWAVTFERCRSVGRQEAVAKRPWHWVTQAGPQP